MSASLRYLGVVAVGAVLLAWLDLADALDATRAPHATVAAFDTLPNPVRPWAALAIGAGAVAVAVAGVIQKRDGNWRGFRLAVIASLLAAFVEIFFPRAHPDPGMQVLETLHQMERAATQGSLDTVVTGAALQTLIDGYIAPPYRFHGEKVTRWTVISQDDCTGPVLKAGGAAPGSVLYCRSADQERAWISAVGLPVENRVGEAQVVSRDGRPVVEVVKARHKLKAPPTPHSPWVQEGSDPGGTSDAGSKDGSTGNP